MRPLNRCGSLCVRYCFIIHILCTISHIFFFTLQSTKHIFMEMYIIANDTVGKRTLEHLASAKGLGAQVYVIYDGLGSISLSQRALAALRGSMSSPSLSCSPHPLTHCRSRITYRYCCCSSGPFITPLLVFNQLIRHFCIQPTVQQLAAFMEDHLESQSQKNCVNR
jgi:hypothetical protein